MRQSLAAVAIVLVVNTAAHAAERSKPPPDDRVDRDAEIAEIQKAAARTAGFDLSKAASWKRRAGNTAWLPEVTVRVKKESFTNDGEKYNTESPYQMFTAGEGLFFEVGARWSLDALVFDRKELDASREAAAVFGEYRRLMEEVGRLHFARKGLIADLAAPDLPREQAAAKQLKLEETTALLDALTGGHLSREAARQKKNGEEAK